MFKDFSDESTNDFFLKKKSKSNLDLLNNCNIFPKITLNYHTKTSEDSK